MTFGFNPLLPAYPTAGTTWSSDPKSRDFAVYGVNGSSTIVGVQKVTVPTGTYQALVVTSTLDAAGLHVRERHAHDVVRAEHRAREARVQARRRQRLHRPADSLRTMDRRTVALGIAAAVAVGAALIVTLAGRSSASPKHKAIATYITAVDQINSRCRCSSRRR